MKISSDHSGANKLGDTGSEMEDDLRPEYDVRSLRVRKVGPQRAGFGKFDATDYLDNEETIAEYLTAALEDEDPAVFLSALADVAKARDRHSRPRHNAEDKP